MRRNCVWITLAACVFALVGAAWAQVRKAGLWELTTTQTWQQSPFPTGSNPAAGGPRTTQVCLTQEQIDKYGAIMPRMHGCQITNIVKSATGMRAEMVCAGRISGKGTLESTYLDGEHAKGKVHFTGTIQVGPDSKPVEWTTESSSTFKSADCGSVKPFPMTEK